MQRLGQAVQEAQGVEPRRDDIPAYEDWARAALPHLFDKPWSTLHDSMGEDFDYLNVERGVRVCYVAPRGGGKSKHIGVGYPLYCICHDLEPFILLTGSTVEVPEGHLQTIKDELTGNLYIRANHPHAFGQGRVWNVKKVITRNGIAIRTVGRGGKVRGAGHGKHRPTIIVGDDIDDEDSTASEDAKDATFKWLTSTIIPLGIEAQVNVFVLGTAMAPRDTTQRLKDTPGWLYRHFQSLIREPARQDLWDRWKEIYRDETIRKNTREIPKEAQPARDFFAANRAEMMRDAVVLWEAQESLYDLMVYRQRNGEGSFLTEKQGDIRGSGMMEWPSECFDERVMFDRFPYLHFRAQVCDPSKGATEKSDFSAWVWGGLGPDGCIYVDADLQRRDARQICDDGVAIAKTFAPHAIGLEGDAYGAIIELWNVAALDAKSVSPPVMTLVNRGDKETVRIRRLTPWLRGYKIRFRRGSPGVEILLQQLRDFPHAKHDDGPDALEMLIRLLIAIVNAGAASQVGAQNGGDVFSVETVNT